MDNINIIDEHTIIRETVGYEFIKKIEIFDLPNVISFLRIVYNYNRMCNKNI